MRKSLWIMLALLVVSAAQVARADSTASFNFSGTLTNSFMGNDSVTGTFTLDLTKGTITAFDFTTPVVTVDASNGFVPLLTAQTALNPATDFVELNFNDGVGDGIHLWFQTDLASFSGNTFFTGSIEIPGGDSVSSVVCVGVFSLSNSLCLNPLFAPEFTSGSATPVTTAPEPASLLLLGTGLLGLAGIKRRRSGC